MPKLFTLNIRMEYAQYACKHEQCMAFYLISYIDCILIYHPFLMALQFHKFLHTFS